MDCDYM